MGRVVHKCKPPFSFGRINQAFCGRELDQFSNFTVRKQSDKKVTCLRCLKQIKKNEGKK